MFSLLRKDHNPAVFRILYLFIYGADAMFTPFLALYFDANGYTGVQASVLLAIVPFSLLLGNVIFGRFAKDYKSTLWLMRILSGLEAIFSLFFALAGNFPLLLVATILFSLANSCYFNFEDTYAAVYQKKKGANFSAIRIFGSIAYVVADVVAYFLLGKIAYKYLFAIGAALFFAGFLTTWFIFPISTIFGEEEIGKDQNSKKRLLSRNFILFFLFYGLLYGSFNAASYIMPLYFKRLGMADNVNSLWSGFRVMVEVISMLLLPLLQKAVKGKNKAMLLVGGSLLALCILTLALIPDRDINMGIFSTLRGIGMSFFLVFSVLLVTEVVGGINSPRALSLCSGFSYCIAGIGNLVTPYIYESIGFLWTFIILFGICLCGVFCLCLIKKEPHLEEAPISK